MFHLRVACNLDLAWHTKKKRKKTLHHLGMKKPLSFNPQGSSAHVVLEDWVEQELVATGDTVY